VGRLINSLRYDSLVLDHLCGPVLSDVFFVQLEGELGTSIVTY